MESFVKKVFSDVSDRYSVMNDIMSLGIHRLWRRKFIACFTDVRGKTLIDVAGGTGDIAKRFLRKGGERVLVIDNNQDMLKKGLADVLDSDEMRLLERMKWQLGDSTDLNVDEQFDFYSNAFGLRNSSNFADTVSNSFKVVKSGGKILFMEFLNPRYEKSSVLMATYEHYLRYIIPVLGKVFANNYDAYRYLADSITNFIAKEWMLDTLARCGGCDVKCEVMNNICAIYSCTKS
ncbi:Ubiquinone/menaquinone biosynthesis C-methyltransferase UbiE [Candidatus Fokinia solitaria]|uniref:Ubiquinone/menaquinone biosynthesis C-methyltransferase UbiE n=1 Tax=Candidatus Fokinia solitaria TaxID=1802984 RepID=A0A2U8BSK4_9RICK|nr:ubiquinone/menaquinone biosynthesis methyltransferase [Candidatus Fokinia solitaria]AWD33260.1 Ubiquinone/menaquinone biosynthesis C-methyltransferase UbiE [Candidatus Fokinia solitaria]